MSYSYPRRFIAPLLLVLLVAFPLLNSLRAAPAAMDKFGICGSPTGYSDPNAFADAVIASGIKWVRMGAQWDTIETANGVYDTVQLAALDAAVDRLTNAGVNIDWILCYTAPWASSVTSGTYIEKTRSKPANWADWEDFVTFVVTRYNGKISHWEVWNEPDATAFWLGSVADYNTLLQKAHAKIKAVNANNKVLLGGLALPTYGTGTFFDSLLALGAESYFDIVNYHSYGSLSDHQKRHRGMLQVINAYNIQSKPVWITETGYTSSGTASLEIYKADMIDQIHQNNLVWNDVERWFLYRFNNLTLTPANPAEENFGLVGTTLAPLPAHRSVQALDGAATDFALQAAYPTQAQTYHALQYYPATSGDGSYVTVSGNDRVVPAGQYMYFRLADDWFYDANQGIDSTVYVDVTYLDSGTNPAYLQYDGASSAYTAVTLPRANTGQWKTVTFTLADAKFANRQNYSADFRLYSALAALSVRNVTVHRSYNPASVILQATPEYKLIEYVLGTGEGANIVGTQGGVECRVIESNAKYLYFRVSDSFARSGDTALDVAITFWDSGTDKLVLQYISTSADYTNKTITKTNTNAWRTVTLALTDADFRSIYSYGADFRIGNYGDGSLEYVRRVDVTRRNQAWCALKTTPEYRNLQYVIAGSGQAANPVATQGGVECRSIAAADKFLYFRANDDLVGAGDVNVDVTITFWDSGTDALYLTYNSTTNGYANRSITKTNTNAWRTVTLALTDANFTNQQYYSADFRIGNGWDTTTEYVSRVELTVH